ncbi:MAG TPA: SIR2 family protein [Pyrinomonadaceae bacterium]|nr:SIR2 family protein [Pyrinomonadaceae bacterium]
MTNPTPLPSRPLPYFIDFSSLYRRSEAISHAFQGGNLVFFLGAGASIAFNSDFPGWAQLLQSVLGELHIEADNREEIRSLIAKDKFLLAAQALKHFAVFDRDDRDHAMSTAVNTILERETQRGGDSILHLGVLDFGAPIVTTNFDTILENVRREHNLDVGGSVFNFADDNAIGIRLDPTEARSQYIFKLHGTAGQGKIILDEGDYANLYFRGCWPRAVALLHHILATKMVVFVGFSLSDPEIMPLLREATRHASSYQHLAFLQKDNVTSIECEVLRSHYRVDPILYENHAELPLYILEMSNFHPRDRLTLKLEQKNTQLTALATEIRRYASFSEDTSVVLFGSYAKYGDWVSDEADLDMLFLSPTEVETDIPISFVSLGRRVDATVLTRHQFETFLRQGDAFASSILVTGSPIVDPKGIFALLARGLQPEYNPHELVENAYNRCKLRWLRLCALRNAQTKVFRRSCQQWALTVMQLALMLRKPPVSLLEASLLGNARYVIYKFGQQFYRTDESFLLDLMRSTKGLALPARSKHWPKLTEAVNMFRNALAGVSKEFERDILESHPSLPVVEADKILAVYLATKDLFVDIDSVELEVSLPGETEIRLLDQLDDNELRKEFSTFDWLFFFELHELATMRRGKRNNKELIAMIESLQRNWKEGKWDELPRPDVPKPD